MACLARTRARDTRVSEFLVSPLFFLVAPLSTCENVPGPGTFLCGPLLKKSGPLFQKSGPLFFTSGPLFQQNDLFWSFILSPTVFQLISLHLPPSTFHQISPVQPKKRSRACVACARVWHTIIKHFSSEKICWFRKLSYLCACHSNHATEQLAQEATEPRSQQRNQ